MIVCVLWRKALDYSLQQQINIFHWDKSVNIRSGKILGEPKWIIDIFFRIKRSLLNVVTSWTKINVIYNNN